MRFKDLLAVGQGSVMKEGWTIHNLGVDYIETGILESGCLPHCFLPSLVLVIIFQMIFLFYTCLYGTCVFPLMKSMTELAELQKGRFMLFVSRYFLFVTTDPTQEVLWE